MTMVGGCEEVQGLGGHNHESQAPPILIWFHTVQITFSVKNTTTVVATSNPCSDCTSGKYQENNTLVGAICKTCTTGQYAVQHESTLG